MNVQDALKLIELGAEAVGAVKHSHTAETVEGFAQLIQKQIATYQEMTGKSIDEVLAKLTYVDPNPPAA